MKIPAVVLPISAADQLQVATAFRSVRATTFSAARRLRDLGLSDSQVLRRMVTMTLIRRAGPDRYFLDEDVWAKRRNVSGGAALRLVLVAGAVVAAAALFMLVK